MCSIGGFIASKPISAKSAESLCTALLYYGRERGDQSGGLYVNKKLFKKAMDPYLLTQEPEYDALFDKPVKAALIHTRQPTCGGRGDDQAQPFVSGEAATVHNGWFLNIDNIKKTWDIKKSSGVDSELVTEFVANYGIMKLPKFLRSVSGSAAFGILYNKELYLMRDGNPTFWTTVDFGDVQVFLFASTGRMLANAMRFAWLIPNDHPIKETKEGILFRCDPKIGLQKLSTKSFTKSFTYADKSKHLYANRFPGHYSGDPWGYGDDNEEIAALRRDLGDYAEIIRASDITHESRILDEASGNEPDSKYDDIRYFTPHRKSNTED